MDFSSLLNNSNPCVCGFTHSVGIEQIDLERGVNALLDFLLYKKYTNVLIVCDSNTVNSYNLQQQLDGVSIHYSVSILPGDPLLIPNESALGSILSDIDNEYNCIISLGSGTLNDLSRFIASRTKTPYIILATAPSMDGYTSSVSPLIIKNKKITYNAVSPEALFASYEVLTDAPVQMLKAGFGDIVGKYTALADWHLANKRTAEFFCTSIEAITRNSVDLCMQTVKTLADKDAKAVRSLMDSLVLSGIAMAMAGNSRPASGSEHHMAHYWETNFLLNSKPHYMHGEMVGVATIVVSRLYELLELQEQYSIVLPTSFEVKELLKTCGALHHPKQINVDKELFRSTIIEARHIRERYTILTFAHEQGLLEGLADRLTDEFYPS